MFEDQPPLVGQKAIGDAFKSFMTPGVSVTAETLEPTAHGPVVMNKHIDTMNTAGRPDQVSPVVGILVVKVGRIAEWTDSLEK